MKRREFGKIVGLNVLAMQLLPSFAVAESLKVPLGVCNHSLRSMGLNAQQLIEYANDQNLDSVLLNTLNPFTSLDRSFLSGLSKNANRNDVSIYVGVGSISERSTAFSNRYGSAEELLIEGIRVASIVGSPIVGCRIGSFEDRYSPGGIEQHMEAVIQVMKAVGGKARDAGIKFAFENHKGDLRSEELMKIINETGTDICGVLFDPANALWAMEDPMIALEVLGSHIICTSVRDVAIWGTEEGAMFQGTTIGKGILDFPHFSEILSRLCPGVPFHVETISNSARPIPYRKPGFWDGYPELHTTEISGFLKLVNNGTPLTIEHPPAGMSQKNYDISIQQTELLSSVSFLREECNGGLKKY